MKDRTAFREHFARLLQRELAERGLPIHQFAEQVGVSATGVRRWLAQKSTPTADTLSAISRVLNISPDELFNVGSAQPDLFAFASATSEATDPTNEVRSVPAFELFIDSDLTPEQIKSSLDALADFFRECGGAGLMIEFEPQEALVLEPVDA